MGLLLAATSCACGLPVSVYVYPNMVISTCCHLSNPSIRYLFNNCNKSCYWKMVYTTLCIGGIMLLICTTGVNSQLSINSSCSTNSQCPASSGVVCDTKRNQPICKVKHDSNCTSTGDCVAGATCVTASLKSVCTCTIEVSPHDGVVGLCNPGNGRWHGYCSNTVTCSSGTAYCSSNMCVCNTTLNTINYVDFSCTPVPGKAGGSCSTSVPCETNAICQNGTCNCKDGYIRSPYTLHCYAKVTVAVGGSCSFNEDCTTNAACIAKICKVTSDAVTLAVVQFPLLLMILVVTSLLL